jgi:lysophospholipase L1-like esterase
MNGHKKARRGTKKESPASPFVSSAFFCFVFVSFCALLWLTNSVASAQAKADRKAPDPARFESEIAAFEKWDRQNAFPKNPILFVGSSSIRLWPTAEAFPDAPVINRGFGGSTIADVNHYFDRIVAKYKPRAIIFYAGDNDIAGGKSPEQVYEDFQEFVRLVRDRLSETPIFFISIKPSIARQKLWPKMKDANSLIEKLAGQNQEVILVDIATPMLAGNESPAKDLFLNDGLHLNAKGYETWNKALVTALRDVLIDLPCKRINP